MNWGLETNLRLSHAWGAQTIGRWIWYVLGYALKFCRPGHFTAAAMWQNGWMKHDGMKNPFAEPLNEAALETDELSWAGRSSWASWADQPTNQFFKCNEQPTNSIEPNSREAAKTVRCSPKIVIWTRSGLDNMKVLLDALH